MATEADLIQKFKDLNIPVGADFEELIHAAFAGSNLADIVNSYDSRIATVETDLTTKADDSKVVHDNKDGTEQLNGTKIQPFNKLSDSIGGRNLLIGTHSAWETFTSTQYAIENLYITDSDKITEIIGKTVSISAELLNCSQNCNVQLWYYDKNNGNARTNIAGGIQTYTKNGKVTSIYNVPSNISASKFEFVLAGGIHSGITGSYMHEQLEQGSIATDWTPAPEDKVNVADMRKPANDVAGIDEVNAKQDKLTITPADDSKVAHLSGANNFDTVPTVNNNPLLLASSLPSDLARTSQQTNFTNGLQSGGVNVATAADLKSLEDASWHEVALPDTSVLKQAHFMYRSEPIDAHYNTSFILTGTVFVPNVKSSDGVILLDLSSYLPIPKDDYKNYTVNSAILGPSDNSFIESDNAGFSPNYYLGENYLGIKLVNSDLVLYSTSGYAYFGTALSTGATISLVMSSDLKSLPTIHFVPSTKS